MSPATRTRPERSRFLSRERTVGPLTPSRSASSPAEACPSSARAAARRRSVRSRAVFMRGLPFYI